MDYILIKENLQKARKILKERDIPEDSKKFQELRELLKNNLGFLGLFTFFRFKRKVSIEKLTELLNTLKKNKSLLGQLPQLVVKYNNIEKLEDDLNHLKEWSVYNREFVRKLTSKFKKGARQDKDLKNAIIHLDRDKKTDLYFGFLPKMARYNNYKDFRIDLLNFINRATNDTEILKSIEENNGSYLVYNEDNIIVAEVYNKETSCKIGSKSWCISGNKGSYWDTYVGIGLGNKQYFLWNLNVPSSNIDSQVGITILPNGNQKTSHLKDDSFVNYISYCNKYDIPVEIFKPFNIKEDVDKLMKSTPMTNKLAKLLEENDLIEDYKDHLPYYLKILYGLLTEEELSSLHGIKKMIYNKEKNDEMKSVILFCNSYEDETDGEEIDEFLKKHKDSEILKSILSLTFRDKIFLLSKYQETTTYRYHSNEYQESLKEKQFSYHGLIILFNNEIINGTKLDNLEFEIDGYGNIEFEFEMGDIHEEILGLSNEEYTLLSNLSSYYNGFFENTEEQDYISRYLSDESKLKIIEYLNHIKQYIIHKDQLKDLEEIIYDFGEGDFITHQDNFTELVKIISYIDQDFCFDRINYQRRVCGYFEDFWDNIIEKAEVLLNEDATIFENNLIGEIDNNKITIELDKIIDSFKNIENKDEEVENTLESWIESIPGNMDGVVFNFDGDYPSDYDYIALADNTEANEELIKRLDHILNGTDDDFNETEEYLKWFKLCVGYLIKRGYSPIKEDGGGWRDEKWYGLIKKIRNNITEIIPLEEINNGGIYVYELNKSIDKMNDGVEDYKKFKLHNLKHENTEKLDKLGITYKYIDLSELDNDEIYIDPNQIELKFEKIKLKSFNQFFQTK